MSERNGAIKPHNLSVTLNMAQIFQVALLGLWLIPFDRTGVNKGRFVGMFQL